MNMNVLHLRHEPVHDSNTRTHYSWEAHFYQFKYKYCVSELLDSFEFDYNDVNYTYDVYLLWIALHHRKFRNGNLNHI